MHNIFDYPASLVLFHKRLFSVAARTVDFAAVLLPIMAFEALYRRKVERYNLLLSKYHFKLEQSRTNPEISVPNLPQEPPSPEEMMREAASHNGFLITDKSGNPAVLWRGRMHAECSKFMMMSDYAFEALDAFNEEDPETASSYCDGFCDKNNNFVTRADMGGAQSEDIVKGLEQFDKKPESKPSPYPTPANEVTQPLAIAGLMLPFL